MKKKTLLSLIAACLFTATLTSCFYDDPWYYGHRHYGSGYYRSAPPRHYGHHGGYYHHGPNAEMDATITEKIH